MYAVPVFDVVSHLKYTCQFGGTFITSIEYRGLLFDIK